MPLRLYAGVIIPGAKVLGLACVAMQLSGCSTFLKKWDDQFAFAVQAEALDLDGKWSFDSPDNLSVPRTSLPVAEGPRIPAPTALTRKERLGIIIYQSERKCADFLTRMSLHQTASAVTFDFASTILSGLGAVFTPLNTVHALSAAAGMASGTKSLIDSDFFARASIANYADAIQLSYYLAMKEYVAGIQASDEESIIYPIEISKIQTIHSQCALAPAQSEISRLLKAAAADSSAQGTTSTITVSGTADAKGGLLNFTVKWKDGTLPPVVFTVKPNEAASDIAADLVANITTSLVPQIPGSAAKADGATVTVTWATPDAPIFTQTTKVGGVTVRFTQTNAPAPSAAVKKAAGATPVATTPPAAAAAGAVKTQSSVVGNTLR